MYFITDKKSAVMDVQRMLSLVFPDKMISTSGIYDDKTKEAVLELQRSSEIRESGRVDMVTFNELRRSYEEAERKIEVRSMTASLPFPIGFGFVSDEMIFINTMLGFVIEYYGVENRVRYNRLYSEATGRAVRIIRTIYGLHPSDQIDEALLFFLKTDYDRIRGYSSNYLIR